MAGIYLRQGDVLVAMRETPYDAEHVLQKLVAEHPQVLAGNAASENDNRRWLLIERESPIAAEAGGGRRWSADHLFIDQDGVPTVVETKRSSDPRARREVVAQMLDYAANGIVSWRAETLRMRFQARCAKDGLDPADHFIERMGELNPETFWMQVGTNLEARRLRLVFVADTVAPELERIVDFLNRQMQVTEVLAIEVKQFVDGTGAHQTIVPRVLGQSQAARQAKGQAPSREWTRDLILAELETRQGPIEAKVAESIFDWAAKRPDLTQWFGTGAKDGCFMATLSDGDRRLLPFGLYTRGCVEVQFQHLMNASPFDNKRMREQLRERLNTIDGIQIPVNKLTLRPSIPLNVLAQPGALDEFLATINWVFEQPPAANTHA